MNTEYKDPLNNALLECREALSAKRNMLSDCVEKSKGATKGLELKNSTLKQELDKVSSNHKKIIKGLELKNSTLKQELDKVSRNHKETIKGLELSNTNIKQRPQEPSLKDPEVRSIEGSLFKQLLIRVGVKPPNNIPDTVSYDSQFVEDLNLNKAQIKTIFKGA